MHLGDYFLSQGSEYVKNSTRFILIIILVDLLPLFAIIFWDWSAIEALYLYTLETIILFWIAIRKMWRSKYIFALFTKQVLNLTSNINERTQQLNPRLKIPKMTWLIKSSRGLLYLLFVILWIPFLLLQFFIISAISGDGYGLFTFFDHDFGKLDLGFTSFNLLYIMLILLLLEHNYAYRKKYVKGKEFENTGLINEGLSFTVRVIIQQFLIIGIFSVIGLAHIDNIAIIIIILLKTGMDLASYIFNRVWGGLKNKVERRRSQTV